MNKSVSSLEVFDRAFNQITKAIKYDRTWSDGKGYHGPFLELRGDFHFLPMGDVMRSITPGGRRLIMIKTRYGMVMVSERYMPGDKRGQHIVVEAGQWIISFFDDYFEKDGLCEPVSGLNLLAVLGHENVETQNIGFLIENFRELSEI